jgi:CDP-diglyceride synthetase
MSLTIINPTTFGGFLAVVLFAGILACLEAGRWLGKRAIGHHGAGQQPSVSSLEGAVFALMGLLVAFTFSGALERFDVRRAQVVQEANAIGTAWLRIDLLPTATQPKLRDSFRSYVDSRIATYRKLPDIAAAKQELARSEQLQSEIWSQAAAAMRLPETRTSTEVLMMGALNEMFDITTTRIAATQMHPPGIVYGMLFSLALAAALLAGYQSAAEKRRDWIHHVGFAAILALTLYVILDIEHPRMGLVRIDAIDQMLVDLRAGMK